MFYMPVGGTYFTRPVFFALLPLWRAGAWKDAAPTGAQSTPPPSRRLERRPSETPFPIGDPKGRCSFGGAPSFERWVYSKLGGSMS